MRDSERRALYARRKVIVEPVFGQTKEARKFRRFLLRGREKVALEWSLLCRTHNLLKLHRAQAASRAIQALRPSSQHQALGDAVEHTRHLEFTD